MRIKKSTQIILNIVALIVVLLIFLPVIIMLPSMFKGSREIFSYPWHFIPRGFTLDNFRYLAYLEYTTMAINYFKSLFMTILVASIAVLLSLTINMIAAYAFARLRFPGKRIIWALILFTMFIPGITILITSIRVVSALNMLNTISVLVIPGLVSAYNMFFFRQFYLNFPKDLDEAAKIDGASIIQIFLRIYLPMSVTPMVIIGASIFMGYYNSYVWPSLVIDQNHKQYFQIMTAIYKLYCDSSELGYGVVLAGAFVAMIPPMIIFVVVQKYIRDGIQLSGTK